MHYEKRKEQLIRIYFDKYHTFVLHRKQTAQILNESESTLDRWKAEGFGPVWHKDERSKNGRVVYMLDDIVDFLLTKNYNQTIS